MKPLLKEADHLQKKVSKRNSMAREVHGSPKTCVDHITYTMAELFDAENKDIRRNEITLPNTSSWQELISELTLP